MNGPPTLPSDITLDGPPSHWTRHLMDGEGGGTFIFFKWYTILFLPIFSEHLINILRAGYENNVFACVIFCHINTIVIFKKSTLLLLRVWGWANIIFCVFQNNFVHKLILNVYKVKSKIPPYDQPAVHNTRRNLH